MCITDKALRLYKEGVTGFCVWILVDKVKCQINIIYSRKSSHARHEHFENEIFPLKFNNVVTKFKATNTF